MTKKYIEKKKNGPENLINKKQSKNKISKFLSQYI